MAEPAPQPCTVEAFVAGQERQPDRHELVVGFPLEMTAGTRNVHDDIAVNSLPSLEDQLRGAPCRPFTADGSVETLPGQIRRPDLGIVPGSAEVYDGITVPPRLRSL